MQFQFDLLSMILSGFKTETEKSRIGEYKWLRKPTLVKCKPR